MAAPPAGNPFSFPLFLLISFTSSIVLISTLFHHSFILRSIVIIFSLLPLNSFLCAPSPPRFLFLLPFLLFALFASPLIATPCPSLLYPSTSLLLILFLSFSVHTPSLFHLLLTLTAATALSVTVALAITDTVTLSVAVTASIAHKSWQSSHSFC